MILSFGMLFQAVLFAVGIWWCVQMLSRGRDDFRKVRETDDWSDRVVIIILWSITGVVVFLCIRFGLNLAGSIVHGIRDVTR